MNDAGRMIGDLRRRLLMVFLATFLVSATGLFVVNETEPDIVRWAMAKELSASDLLWLLRLFPMALGCGSVWGGFFGVWSGINRRQRSGDLSPASSRVRGYSAGLFALLLVGLLAHLYFGGPP